MLVGVDNESASQDCTRGFPGRGFYFVSEVPVRDASIHLPTPVHPAKP